MLSCHSSQVLGHGKHQLCLAKSASRDLEESGDFIRQCFSEIRQE